MILMLLLFLSLGDLFGLAFTAKLTDFNYIILNAVEIYGNLIICSWVGF